MPSEPRAPRTRTQTVVVAPAATPRRRAAAKPKKQKRARRRKKPDLIEDALALGGGYFASDIMPILPLVGPALAKLPLPPQIPAAGASFIAGRLAGGQWRRAGNLAALGSALNYVISKAKEAPAGEPPKVKGVGEADVPQLTTSELLDRLETERAAPAALPAMRTVGEILRQ